ncbi:MAG: type II toxin-antitoxin system YafQ family toxin [Candidatus Anammoxibacter sp.]
MKSTIRRTSQFKRDIKRLLRSGKDIEKLLSILEELTEGRKLSPEYQDHILSGKYKNKRDCHIETDWILIYAREDNELVLYRTGSHSQLFR